ncbi:MAG: hypothetical protein U5K72_14420 [Balneolaceae bacterium]|nr:hypothetical protein [Balneolaceae bacterium]
MQKNFLSILFISLLIFSFKTETVQSQNLGRAMFQMAEGFVRIAEPGQLADTVTVWGDISSAGRYIIPRGTKPHELISYARGPQTRMSGGGQEVALDWSKLRLELSISTYHPERGRTVQSYEFRYSDPYPAELRNYRLQNDQIVSLQVKRRPGLTDYLRVLGPVLSVTTTTILLIDRLQN